MSVRPLKRDGVALSAFLEARGGWVFGYGPQAQTHDCARFVGAGVKVCRGVDPLNDFSSSWTTLRGARRVLLAHGGMARAVSEVMSPVAVTMAMRGDVGMTAVNTLVLIEGDTVVGLHPERGLIREPRSVLTLAWTVRP